MAARITIPLSFLGSHFWLVFGGLWLACGLPFVFAGFHQLELEQRFEREAVTVDGKVLTRDIVRAKSKDGGSSTRYEVSYRYTVETQTHEGRAQVDAHVWEELREQEPLSVQYLPGNPSRSRPVGADDWAGAYILTGLGGFFSIAGGFIVLVDLRGRFVRARLRRDGISASATITRVAPTNFRINGVTQWRVHYTYPDHRGRVHTGKSPIMSCEEAESWTKGDQIQVRYDHRRAERSVWLGRNA